MTFWNTNGTEHTYIVMRVAHIHILGVGYLCHPWHLECVSTILEGLELGDRTWLEQELSLLYSLGGVGEVVLVGVKTKNKKNGVILLHVSLGLVIDNLGDTVSL